MNKLDVKILRALMSERAVAPSHTQVNSSLRSIAARVGADDMTVNYRFRRLQETGALSGWKLMVNPTFFGSRLMTVAVDAQPESAKPDMIRKLKLVHEVTGIIDFYGGAMNLIVMFNSAESRSRIVELISRITNSERFVQVRWALPQCRTERLTETDIAIIMALSNDARKSFVRVSKELDLSARTVRNRVLRLRKENTVFALPALNMGSIPGLIPVYLSYSYSRERGKPAVDRAMLAHFEETYFSAGFADPALGNIQLSASTMSEVQDILGWVKSQPGVASARADILTKTHIFPEKLTELLDQRTGKEALQRKAYF